VAATAGTAWVPVGVTWNCWLFVSDTTVLCTKLLAPLVGGVADPWMVALTVSGCSATVTVTSAEGLRTRKAIRPITTTVTAMKTSAVRLCSSARVRLGGRSGGRPGRVPRPGGPGGGADG